ncbi:cell envelope integrity/translocation protein TolA [Bacillus cereus]|uniref:sunset domain-containing protein n=1 Tax=Bacillus cereus TaxID=1396 RepID=UPI00062D3E2C|nr:cell envelope integrity/translocation protein TolA [Bacillus cereus]KLA29115.1 Multimodular transpeptidase-transglycosylase [Bacillus cereus]
MNWRKIFGYRSKTAWKMFIASIVYIFILFLILQAIIPNSIRPALVNIGFLGFSLSLLALIIGLIKPQFMLPKIQIKTRKKVVYSYLYLALAFFLMGIVFIDGKSTSNQTVQKADTKVATSQDTKKDTADTKSKEEANRKAQEETQRKAQEEASQKSNAVVSSSSGNHNGSNRKPFQNDPSDDKESNTTCKGQIKGNANSKKYHVPGGQYYDSTKDNIVWFCSETDAQAAGYVRSKK